MKDILSARLESGAFSADAVELYELTGCEVISQLFEFQLHIVCKSPEGLDEEALLAEPAALVFLRGDREERRLFGEIAVVRDALLTEASHMAYTLTFVPRAFRMTLTETSEIFMDLSVPEILKKKLERAGLCEGDDFELRLVGSYPPREYVVQYRETDLQFASRLAEHLGISFFFEHRDDRDVIVFTDANSGFPPIPGGGRAYFHPRGEHVGVHRIEGTTRKVPGRYVVKDYNYRTPHVPLMAAAAVSDAAGGGIVEYGAHFKTPDEGERIAAIRAEELRAGRKVFEGASDVQALGAGARFTLEGHPRGDIELLLVEVRHRLQQATMNMGTGGERAYANELRAIPFATTYRPPRVTPKPRVHGAITGVIDAAEKGQYAEVDEAGRYRVRFQFDTSGAEDGKASRLVRMAQPHAGAGYGFHFPLRSGVEVILTCIDGDPDRPIITGAVPNPQTPSTVGAKNGRRNVIRTGGGNEINIDDTEGEERIKLSTPFGGATFQLGAPNTPEAGAALTTTEAFTAVGAAGVNTLTSVSTTLADVASLWASSSITHFASGASSIRSALLGDKGVKIVNGIASVAKGALDGFKKWDAYQQAQADEAAVVEEERMKRALAEAQKKDPYPELDPPMRFDRYGVPRSMTKEEWETERPAYAKAVEATRRFTEAKKQAEDLKKTLAEEDLTRRQWAAGVDAASELGKGAKGLIDGYKAREDLINNSAQRAGKAADAASVATAKSMAAATTSFAGVARVAGVVPGIGSPHFLGGAVNSAVLIGMADAFVGGTASAALSSGGQAIVAGGTAAMLKSPVTVSIGAGARTLITAGAKLDLLSRGSYVSRSTGPSRTHSRGPMKISTSSSLDVSAKNTQIKSNGAIAIQSTDKTTISAAADLDETGANISLKANAKAEVRGGSSVEVKGGDWGMTAVASKVTVGNGADGLEVTSGMTEIRKGASKCTVTAGVARLAKGNNSVQCSSSKVTVNGSRIDLG
ncbi:type VI secretion system tip protein TssI/VgrG [Sorangium sp. So ce426]|uniref:type VI secretion system Vgr family protein n=1 Tax=Sorangium sp. So ce426 TaxID=3133312 RepID=UPI003F5BCFB8